MGVSDRKAALLLAALTMAVHEVELPERCLKRHKHKVGARFALEISAAPGAPMTFEGRRATIREKACRLLGAEDARWLSGAGAEDAQWLKQMTDALVRALLSRNAYIAKNIIAHEAKLMGESAFAIDELCKMVDSILRSPREPAELLPDFRGIFPAGTNPKT
jgi:hypothetical protein